jgi:hypothetical protein
MKINMSTKALLASVIAAGALASSPAFATEFIGTVTPTYNSNDSNGLGVSVDPIHSAFDFNLNSIGQSFTLSLFNLFTDESSVDSSDKIAKAISVAFKFTQPVSSTTTISGTTFGVTDPINKNNDYEYGQVAWGNGGIGALAFGNGGLLQIALIGDTIFNYGKNGLDDLGDCDGSAAQINAKFTLEHLSTSVPEPYEWALMLMGVGLVGATLRQNRRRAAVVTA